MKRTPFEIRLTSYDDIKRYAKDITYPVRVLPIYSAGDTGISTAANVEQLYAAVEEAWLASPIGMVVITNAGT